MYTYTYKGVCVYKYKQVYVYLYVYMYVCVCLQVQAKKARNSDITRDRQIYRYTSWQQYCNYAAVRRVTWRTIPHLPKKQCCMNGAFGVAAGLPDCAAQSNQALVTKISPEQGSHTGSVSMLKYLAD